MGAATLASACSLIPFKEASAGPIGDFFLSLIKGEKIESAKEKTFDKTVWSSYAVNCGSRCALRLHVKNDEVVKVETDNNMPDEYGNH